jgi:hypothetical protein
MPDDNVLAERRFSLEEDDFRLLWAIAADLNARRPQAL